MRRAGGRADAALRGRRVVWQAASICLSYPEETTVARGPLLRSALAESAPEAGPSFAELLDAWDSSPLTALQLDYVDTFDMTRKVALYLSYYSDGDTRRRGETLARFKARYRTTDHLVRLHGELPDYLPLVCEYAAIADPDGGAALLQEYRSSLELLRLALQDRRSPYTGVLAAVCGTLPGPSPADRREVLALASNGPPTESVGLDPYDPRLLPVLTPTLATTRGR